MLSSWSAFRSNVKVSILLILQKSVECEAKTLFIEVESDVDEVELLFFHEIKDINYLLLDSLELSLAQDFATLDGVLRFLILIFFVRYSRDCSIIIVLLSDLTLIHIFWCGSFLLLGRRFLALYMLGLLDVFGLI